MASAVLNVESKPCKCECFQLTLEIDNLYLLTNSIFSSEIISSHECMTSWQIIAKIVSGYERISFHNSFFKALKVGLRRNDSKNFRVNASLFFEINSSRGGNSKESIENSFAPVKPVDVSCGVKEPEIAYSNMIKILKNDSFLLDEKLTIRGNLFIQDFSNDNIRGNNHWSLENLKELQSNFKDLCQSNKFADVIFNFEDEELYAHKALLCARSPVFEKMFDGMMEDSFSCVSITDIERSVFSVFLIFLYTGEVENTGYDTLIYLYPIAKKYEVTTLFKACSNILVSHISDETASVILNLADAHSDESLKEKAVDFICKNFATVGDTSEWKNLLDTDPQLASDTLRLVSSFVAAKERSTI